MLCHNISNQQMINISRSLHDHDDILYERVTLYTHILPFLMTMLLKHISHTRATLNTLVLETLLLTILYLIAWQYL